MVWCGARSCDVVPCNARDLSKLLTHQLSNQLSNHITKHLTNQLSNQLSKKHSLGTVTTTTTARSVTHALPWVSGIFIAITAVR